MVSMTPKSVKKQQAALIRWNAPKRRHSIFMKMVGLIAGYEHDHGPMQFDEEEAYIILAGMGYRTERCPLELFHQLGLSSELKVLD